MDQELLRAENELERAIQRYRTSSNRILLKRLVDLPSKAVGELCLLLLERLGGRELKSVQRTGASNAELHLFGTMPGALGDVATAIVVKRDGREVGRERVMELRGALHHYGPASQGVIITTGQVLSGAREEAAASAATPVKLFDGPLLAALCERHTVGVVTTNVNLTFPDVDLLESLRGS